jgi:HK97 family phage major capsid protein
MPEPYRVVSALPTGTALSRFLMVHGLSRGDSYRAQVIADRWKDTPTVAATLELRRSGDDWRKKAAVAAGSTSDATWASPLAPYGIAAEALEIERGLSIVQQLAPRMRKVPFRTKVSHETGSGTGGAWVGEGLSTPAAAGAYETLSQEVYKAQKIVALSTELLKIGSPSAERTVRETVMAGAAAFVDSQFLTNTVTLSANVRPAAITNGATAITSTGSAAAEITTDLNGMLNAITTAGSGLTWIMRPLTAYRIAATLGASAAGDVPRTLFGIPLILSLNSPQQVTLVDASCILLSDEGGIDVETAEETSLQMDSAPDNPPTASTVFVSLWQQNLWAVKVTRWVAYLRAVSGSVVYMTVTY